VHGLTGHAEDERDGTERHAFVAELNEYALEAITCTYLLGIEPFGGAK